MKAIQFITDILQLTRKISYQGIFRSGSADHLGKGFQTQSIYFFLAHTLEVFTNIPLKASLIYLSKAFGEGLKLNFLGPGVNTEFATLTVRVYVTAFVKLVIDNPVLTSIISFTK